MTYLTRIVDRARLAVILLIAVPIGMVLLAPPGASKPQPSPDGASSAQSGWQVTAYDTAAVDAVPLTHAEILERFAAAGGTLSDAELAGQTGLAGGPDEGEGTTELPAGYVAGGGAPDAQLAATLRAAQARNSGAAAPASGNLAQSVATNPRIIFTRQSQIADITSGNVDPRVLDLLSWIASRRGSITITSMRTDHSTCVAGSNPCRVSAHHLGRAVDIAAVNGEPCGGTPSGQCGLLYEEIVGALRGTPYQPSQIIYGYDPWPAESWNFEMSNHHDHIHIGY